MNAASVPPDSSHSPDAQHSPDDATLAGQAVYSRRMLNWYDLIVLAVSNRWIWRCPTPRLLAWYERHVSAKHLDVGVGTGYFLDRCRFPQAAPRITLVDLNAHCLEAAAARIRRYAPATVRADVLQPFDVPGGPYPSVGLNYLLHCLPGDLTTKACVFDHVAVHLSSTGVLFGSTLLGDTNRAGGAARCLAAFYNRRQIFSNAHDRLVDLERELRARFREVEIEQHGCAALFAARGRL